MSEADKTWAELFALIAEQTEACIQSMNAWRDAMEQLNRALAELLP